MKKWHLLSIGMLLLQLIYPLCRLIARVTNVNFVFYSQLAYEIVVTGLFVTIGTLRLIKKAPVAPPATNSPTSLSSQSMTGAAPAASNKLAVIGCTTELVRQSTSGERSRSCLKISQVLSMKRVFPMFE